MATELGVAYISLLPEMKSFRPAAEKGMDRVGKGVATRFGVGFNGAIGSIVSRSAGIFAAGFASVKLGGFLKDAITQASDLGETTSKVTQIFGPAAKDILKFSKTSAAALGQTQQAALDANATFGIFGKAAGLQGKELSGFTTNLTTLASDLASFNNTSPEQAIEAIGAALRGETEPMRAYGVLLDDASLRQEALAQGLIKTTKQALTPQQKVLAAQALIMKQTTTAQGDFARTSGGLANQQRILSARFNDFKTTVGAIALPLVTRFFGFLNEKAIPVLSEIRGGFVAFIEAFKAGDGDITSSGFPGFMEKLAFHARQAFDYFKAEALPRLKEFGGFIKDTVVPALRDMAGFVSRNKDFFVPFAATILAVVAGLKAWAIVQGILNVVMSANPIGLVVIAIAALVAGLIYAYKNSETFRKVLQGAFTGIQKAAQFFAPLVKAAIDIVIAVFKLWWNYYAKPILKGFGDALTTAWGLATKFKDIVVSGFNAIKEPARAALKFVIDKFLGFVQNILDGAATAFGWIPDVGDKLKSAATEFGKFKTNVNKALDGINDEPVDIKVGLAYTQALGQRTKQMKFATGGGVFGAGTGTSDSIPALLSNNEHVITAKEVRGAGGHRAIEAMRAQWARGYASGGVVLRSLIPTGSRLSSLASAASSGVDLAGTTVARLIAQQLVKLRVNPGLSGALSFARSQAGKPYVWGGVGPGGYDCSGFLSALVNVAQGRSPHTRRFATGNMPAGLFAPGPGAFSVGWFRGNPGHTAGTLNGVNVESRGGRGVVVGSSARGATNGLFNSGVYHLKGFARGGRVGDPAFDLLNPRGKQYIGDSLAREILPKALSFDNGGMLPTGYSIAHNGTGSPEPVGHDILRASDLNGMRIVLDAGDVTLTGHIRLTARDEIKQSNKALKRRVGMGA